MARKTQLCRRGLVGEPGSPTGCLWSAASGALPPCLHRGYSGHPPARTSGHSGGRAQKTGRWHLCSLLSRRRDGRRGPAPWQLSRSSSRPAAGEGEAPGTAPLPGHGGGGQELGAGCGSCGRGRGGWRRRAVSRGRPHPAAGWPHCVSRGVGDLLAVASPASQAARELGLREGRISERGLSGAMRGSGRASPSGPGC